MLWKFVLDIFVKFLKDNPGYFFLNIFFFTASIVDNYYLPKYYGSILDIFNKDLSVFLNAFLNILIVKSIIFFISEFQSYYVNIQNTCLEEVIHKELIDKIKNKYITNPNDIIIGEKVAAITSFQTLISEWYYYFFNYIISYVVTIGFFLGYVSLYDYIMPLIIIGFLGLSWYLLFSNTNNCKNISSQSTSSYLRKYQDIEDYLSNILTIHTYQQFEQENKRLKDLSKEYQNTYNANNRCSLKWSLLGTIVSGLFLLTIMYRCFMLLKKDHITKAIFLSIYFIGSDILETLAYLSDTLHEIKRGYKLLQNIEKDTQLDFYNKTDLQNIDHTIKINVPIINTKSIIKLINIEYKYPGSNQPIINNFNMEIKEGERIALIGDIGTGKSTLLKIILGLLKPTSGDLYLNGKHYARIDQRDIFKRFGYMTQNPVLFNRSIIDNIMFGNPDVTREEVTTLLERFKLNDVFGKLEKGLDSSVGKNGSKISGGQRQIIWFLRIYLQNPDILLMDEPTASLSPESKETLWNLIKQGFANKTIIMSSHDDFLIKMATRKVNMKQTETDLEKKEYGFKVSI